MTHGDIFRMSKHIPSQHSAKLPAVAARARVPRHLTKTNFHSFLNDNKDTFSIINIHHPMCIPCRQVVAKVNDWCEVYPYYAFGLLEYEKESRLLLKDIGVYVVPTIQVYRYEQKILEVTGVTQLSHIKDLLDKGTI